MKLFSSTILITTTTALGTTLLGSLTSHIRAFSIGIVRGGGGRRSTITIGGTQARSQQLQLQQKCYSPSIRSAASHPDSKLIHFLSTLSGGATTTEINTMTASTTTTSPNPLLIQEDLPKFGQIQPSDLTPAVEDLLAKLQDDFTALETRLTECIAKEDPTVSYDDVVPVMEQMQFPLGFAWGVAGHLNGVKNTEELRSAYEANQPKIVKAMSQFQQSKPIFDALTAIQKSFEEEVASTENNFHLSQRKRAVETSLRDMKLGGVGLDGTEKEKFNEMKMKLASLATKFSNNVLDETKAFSLTVIDPAKMEGVPESAKAMWAQAHVMAIKKDRGDQEIEMNVHEGPWRITLDIPSYMAVMSHMRDRTVREQVYRAYIARAAESSPERNNIPLIYEILKIKQEMSQMLGFKNYAEQSLSRKMAPNVESVTELSQLIAEKALPAAWKELEEVTQLARKQGGDEYSSDKLEKLMPWDVTFWGERLKESKFDLTEEETRPYFSLPAVLDGMFSLVSRIFNIEVRAADGEAEIWNPDVRFFKVFDIETDKHIASFYLDPYSRPADKRGGAWMDTCIGKSAALQRDVPVAYLVCNGSPPVGEKPSLMTFREVETLFHEFGHGLQHMLTKADVGDVAGINGVEWDAVELPSQFMENWCYDRPTIFGIAKHWETGETMPEVRLCNIQLYEIANREKNPPKHSIKLSLSHARACM